jgi:Zn finger protein HypA/HybF involved in hydrogenase expression
MDTMLRCEECGKQARTEEEARRWRAYLAVVEEDEPEDVVVYCPDCAKREFGLDDGRPMRVPPIARGLRPPPWRAGFR